MKPLEQFLRFSAGMVMVGALLEAERQVIELARFPELAELHWQITCRLAELEDERERRERARARLLGERSRPLLELDPPRRPTSPSREMAALARPLSEVLRLAA
jgi:hypothetical protein